VNRFNLEEKAKEEEFQSKFLSFISEKKKKQSVVTVLLLPISNND